MKYSLSRDEAAAMLKVTPPTISRLVCKLKYGVHYVKVGRRILFDPDALTNWLEILPAKRKT
jgi:excisionase family DNA binding protein